MSKVTLESDLKYLRDQLKTVDNRFTKALYALDRIEKVLENKDSNVYNEKIIGNYFDSHNEPKEATNYDFGPGIEIVSIPVQIHSTHDVGERMEAALKYGNR
jgi:hypothetical protein